jgi:hypothetical protein
MPDASAACDDAGHESSVAGQVLCSRESVDCADLQPDKWRENLTDAGHSTQQPDLGRRLQSGSDAFLDLFDLDFELIERGELHPDHRCRIAGQTIKHGVDVDAALDAEHIADPSGLQAITVEGGVNAVLERRPQIAQRHTGSQQFATIAQLAGRNPALGQVPLCSRMAKPLASSASVLLVLPIRFLASVGLARCGRWPAFSISSTIQYQWPVASRAISRPVGRLWRKSMYSWR